VNLATAETAIKLTRPLDILCGFNVVSGLLPSGRILEGARVVFIDQYTVFAFASSWVDNPVFLIDKQQAAPRGAAFFVNFFLH
jgi:hypothetical protein